MANIIIKNTKPWHKNPNSYDKQIASQEEKAKEKTKNYNPNVYHSRNGDQIRGNITEI